MNRHFSATAISATLATLGATALVACSGAPRAAESPVDAKEVPAAGQGSHEANCSSANCAAKPKGSATPESQEANCSGAKHEESSVRQPDPGSQEAPASTETKAAASTQPAAAASAGEGNCGAASDETRAMHPMPKHKPRGQGSRSPKPVAGAVGGCGAGTCG